MQSDTRARPVSGVVQLGSLYNLTCTFFRYDAAKGIGQCRVDSCDSGAFAWDGSTVPSSLRLHWDIGGATTTSGFTNSPTIKLTEVSIPPTYARMYARSPTSYRVPNDLFYLELYGNVQDHALEQWGVQFQFEPQFLQLEEFVPGDSFVEPQVVQAGDTVGLSGMSKPNTAPTGAGIHLCTVLFTVRVVQVASADLVVHDGVIRSIVATSMTSTQGNQFVKDAAVQVFTSDGNAAYGYRASASLILLSAPVPLAVFGWPRHLQRHVLYGPKGNTTHRALDIDHVFVFGAFGFESTSSTMPYHAAIGSEAGLTIPSPTCSYADGTGVLINNGSCTGILATGVPEVDNRISISIQETFTMNGYTGPVGPINPVGSMAIRSWVAQIVSVRSSSSVIRKACTTGPGAMYTMVRIKKNIQFSDGEELHDAVEVSGTPFDFDLVTSQGCDSVLSLVRSEANPGVVYARGIAPGTCTISPSFEEGVSQTVHALVLTVDGSVSTHESIVIAPHNRIAWSSETHLPQVKKPLVLTMEGQENRLIAYFRPSGAPVFLLSVYQTVNLTSPYTQVYDVTRPADGGPYWRGAIQPDALATAFQGGLSLGHAPPSIHTCPLGVMPIQIEMPQLVDVLLCCSGKLAVEGDPAAASGYLPASLPNAIRVVGVFSDGREVDFTNDPRSSLIVLDNSAHATTISKAAGISGATSAGTIIVQANLTLFTSNLSDTITFEAVAASSLQVQTTKFDTFTSPMLHPSTLLNIQCSLGNIHQRFQATATMTFTDQHTMNVPTQDAHLFFDPVAAGGVPASTVLRPIERKGVFDLSTAATVHVVARYMDLTSGASQAYTRLEQQTDIATVTGITVADFPAQWIARKNSITEPSYSVMLSDGNGISDISRSFAPAPVFDQVLVLNSEDTTAIQAVGGKLKLVGNAAGPVTVTVSSAIPTNQMSAACPQQAFDSTIVIQPNLLPQLDGDIDLGKTTGAPVAAYQSSFDVDVRVLAESASLLGLETTVLYNARHLKVLSCTAGNSMASNPPSCTMNDPEGEVSFVSSTSPACL